jgi:flagellar assembly protein FliH
MSSRARRVAEDVGVDAFKWERIESPAPASPAAGSPMPIRSDDSQLRLAALERDAFAKGYAQGERAGAEAAATRTEAMLRRMSQTLEELSALRAEMIRRTERQMVQLILAIAERVVHREITLDRGLLVGMARAALDRLGEHASATIRLHPDDYSAIASTAAAHQGGQVQVVGDPVVSRGGCLVQSDFGFLDVSPDAQFRELARALLDELDAPSPVAVERTVVID